LKKHCYFKALISLLQKDLETQEEKNQISAVKKRLIDLGPTLDGISIFWPENIPSIEEIFKSEPLEEKHANKKQNFPKDYSKLATGLTILVAKPDPASIAPPPPSENNLQILAEH